MVRKRDYNHRNNSQGQGDLQGQSQQVQNQQAQNRQIQNQQGQVQQTEQSHSRYHVQGKNISQGQNNSTAQNHNQTQNHSQVSNKSYNQNQKNQPAKNEAAHSREGGPNKSFHRDRENQPRQHTGLMAASSRYNPRNRAEETIEDIKEDIIRIEKEIELEIKEIKSLKL